MPIEPTVLPNPLFTDFIMSSIGMPEKIPKPMAAMIRARKGCSLSLVVERTMNAIAIISSAISMTIVL